MRFAKRREDLVAYILAKCVRRIALDIVNRTRQLRHHQDGEMLAATLDVGTCAETPYRMLSLMADCRKQGCFMCSGARHLRAGEEATHQARRMRAALGSPQPLRNHRSATSV